MNPLQRLIGFISRPDHKRTFSILAALAILAAVPLTVYVAQQRQEIRQRAIEGFCDPSKYYDPSTGQCLDQPPTPTTAPCIYPVDPGCPPPTPTPSLCDAQPWLPECQPTPTPPPPTPTPEPCIYPVDPGCPPPSTSTPTPTPALVGGGGNYCTAAGRHECTPGTSSGTCSKDGKTCTAYEHYACNYGGKKYCDSNKGCAEPCTSGGGPPPTPTPGGSGPPPPPPGTTTCSLAGQTPENSSNCVSCITSARPDIRTSYNNWGHSACSNEQVVNHWCNNLDQTGCSAIKNSTCSLSCGGATPTPTSIPPTRIVRLPTDVNNDGCISILDFNEWLTAFKNNGTPRNPNYRPDINNDGRVDIIDFNLWLRALQSGQNPCR